MRTCPNCGHMLSEKDTICFKCGMQLSQIEKPRVNIPQQPMNFNQMNKGNNKGPRTLDDDKTKTIYIVLAAVIVLSLLAVIMVFVSKNNKVDTPDPNTQQPQIILKPGDEEEEKNDPTKEVIEPEKPTPVTPDPNTGGDQNNNNNNNNNQTPVGGEVILGENEHEVSNNGYKYAVPNEYSEKDYGTKGVHLINYKKTKQMIININLGTVANLKQNIHSVKQIYVDAGAIVHDVKTMQVNGIEIIAVELTKNGQNMIIGIADAAAGEIFAVNVYNSETNTADYNLLTEGIKIIQSAVKIGTTVAA